MAYQANKGQFAIGAGLHEHRYNAGQRTLNVRERNTCRVDAKLNHRRGNKWRRGVRAASVFYVRTLWA